MSKIDFKQLRSIIKDQIEREDVEDILFLSGYEITSGHKFRLRDEDTPSASIRHDGFIKDFGDDWSGDIIALLHEKKGMALGTAVTYVAEQIGLDTGAITTPFTNTPQPLAIPVKKKPTITKERYSEIVAQVWQYDQNKEKLQTFKNPDYAKELLSTAPKWLWVEASRKSITAFRELTTYDDKNKSLVIKIRDYSDKLISFKHRRLYDKKWMTAKETHPNSQCLFYGLGGDTPTYVVEGHHDLITGLLLGVNVLMIPTVGYKKFTNEDMFFLSGQVVFLPDLKRGDTKGIDTMNLLCSQVSHGIVLSYKRIFDLMDIKFQRDSLDLSDVVSNWSLGLNSLKSVMLYAVDSVEGDLI